MDTPHTRDVILDRAERFLADGRVRDMTVSVLMEPLPMTREAFYKHFESRFDLVAALLDRFDHEMDASFELWVRDPDPAHGLRALFDLASHTYVRRSRLMRAVADASALDPKLEAIWHAFLGHYIEGTAAQIRVHQELGLASRSVDARLCAAAIIHLIERLITQELASPNPPAREQVADLLTRVMLGLVYPHMLIQSSVADAWPRNAPPPSEGAD